MTNLTLNDFHFNLPEQLIAQQPTATRTGSRLLNGTTTPATDCAFSALPQLLHADDLLIFNDTQVMQARLFGHKTTGGKLEMLVERVLHHADLANTVAAHLKVSKKPAAGDILHMQGGFTATVLGRYPDSSGALFHLQFSGDPYQLMQQHGHIPLPPYIQREDNDEDAQRYQTIFAKNLGAVAAPTAALHFDAELLQALQQKGIAHAKVTLHVGAGTFQPVKTHDISQHIMHAEHYHIPQATIDAIAACRKRYGRVVAIGTTSVRALESWAATGKTHGDTNIFITPGFRFAVVDTLLTNFHLPQSTLLMLVSAFSGHQHIMALYQHAIAQQYRFFSYGDAMLLSRAS